MIASSQRRQNVTRAYKREDARVGGLEEMKLKCMDKCKWRLFYHAHYLEGEKEEKHQCKLNQSAGAMIRNTVTQGKITASDNSKAEGYKASL